MSRPFYSEYVRHCLRFYSRNLHVTKFRTNIDEMNWRACHKAMFGLPDKSKDIIVCVYGGRDTLADEVYNASRKFDVHQNIIWDMMKDFEHSVAVCRGLV